MTTMSVFTTSISRILHIRATNLTIFHPTCAVLPHFALSHSFVTYPLSIRRPFASLSSKSSTISATSDTTQPTTPTTTWRSLFRSLLIKLHQSGFYSSDLNVSVEEVEWDKGAQKRAVLNFSRKRADILTNLPREAIDSLISVGIPPGNSDRKTTNAYRRLMASYINKADLGPGGGGAADLQDVLRFMLAWKENEAATRRNAPPTFTNNAEILLTKILEEMDIEVVGPVLSEKAKNIMKMQSGGRVLGFDDSFEEDRRGENDQIEDRKRQRPRSRRQEKKEPWAAWNRARGE